MMTEAALTVASRVTCTPRSVKSWKTAVGRASLLQTVCSLDLGGRAVMALGGLLCLFDPRYRKRVNRRKLRRRLYEAQSIVNSVDYFLAIAAALLWQLARNAEGDVRPIWNRRSLASQCRSFASNTGQSGAVLSGGCADSGQTSALNVWATWCPTCRAEHQYLNRFLRRASAWSA